MWTVEKLFNLKAGFTKADDTLPERLLTVPAPSGTAKGKVNELDRMLPEYYTARGWKFFGRVKANTVFIFLGVVTVATALTVGYLGYLFLDSSLPMAGLGRLCLAISLLGMPMTVAGLFIRSRLDQPRDYRFALAGTSSLLGFYVAFALGRMSFLGPMEIGISSIQAKWFLLLEIVFAFLGFLGTKDLPGFIGICAGVGLTVAYFGRGGVFGGALREAWLRAQAAWFRLRLARMKQKRGMRIVPDDQRDDDWVH